LLQISSSTVSKERGMAQSKESRGERPRRPGDRRAPSTGEQAPGDRRPGDDNRRQSIESPIEQTEGERNPAVNQPIGSDDRGAPAAAPAGSAESHRPGGRGDVSH
jgi:hypothetical protein